MQSNKRFSFIDLREEGCELGKTLGCDEGCCVGCIVGRLIGSNYRVKILYN